MDNNDSSIWQMQGGMDWGLVPITHHEKAVFEQTKAAMQADLAQHLKPGIAIVVTTGKLFVTLSSKQISDQGIAVTALRDSVNALAAHYGVEASTIALQTPMANDFAERYRRAIIGLDKQREAGTTPNDEPSP